MCPSVSVPSPAAAPRWVFFPIVGRPATPPSKSRDTSGVPARLEGLGVFPAQELPFRLVRDPQVPVGTPKSLRAASG